MNIERLANSNLSNKLDNSMVAQSLRFGMFKKTQLCSTVVMLLFTCKADASVQPI